MALALPWRVKVGEQPSAENFNRLRRCVRALWLTRGIGGVTVTKSSTLFKIEGGGAGFVPLKDWGNITHGVHALNTVYWNDGDDLPAGNYTISYVDGAFQYAPGEWNIDHTIETQFWAAAIGDMNVYWNGGANSQTVPIATGGTQAEAESAQSGWHVNFNHAGGAIYITFVDINYSDNLDGDPNPTYNLSQNS